MGLFFFPPGEGRLASGPSPPSLPLLSDSCLGRNGFGASGGSQDTNRSWATVLILLICHLLPPGADRSATTSPPPHARHTQVFIFLFFFFGLSSRLLILALSSDPSEPFIELRSGGAQRETAKMSGYQGKKNIPRITVSFFGAEGGGFVSNAAPALVWPPRPALGVTPGRRGPCASASSARCAPRRDLSSELEGLQLTSQLSSCIIRCVLLLFYGFFFSFFLLQDQTFWNRASPSAAR